MSPLHIAPIPAIPDFIVVVDLARPIKEEDEKISIQAISVLLDLVKKYMFIPYHIENWIILIDIHEKGIMSLPLGMLKSFIINM